jgi:anti-anti-sigma factor
MTDVSGGQLQISMRPTVGVDRWRIAVAGELDVDTSPQLVDAVGSALSLPGCRDVIVDLGQVTFADASAVNALVRARLACRHVGGRLTVFGARGVVAEILYLTGVAESFGLPARRARMLGIASDR